MHSRHSVSLKMKYYFDTSSPRLFLSPPHMGGEELGLIQEAFKTNYIAPLGPMVDAFEREFADFVGMRHCLAVTSGTAAMHLALRVLGVGAGDEVFASTLTFIGSVTPIVFQCARPVFIDADPAVWNMDPDLLAGELERCAKQGKLPRAVVPTDLYGQCCDYERIFAVCEGYGVPVVLDSAEALGARYLTQRRKGAKGEAADGNTFLGELGGFARDDSLHAGKGARAAVFSFNGNKILTTSGGGMLASDDADLIARARKLSQQARESFPHYEHEEIGYNYRMSNLLAAVGLGQLEVLEERVRRKREIFSIYDEALKDVPGVSFMPEAPYGKSNRWLTVVLIDPERFGADREQVRLALEAENIESRPVWKPMHLQPVFDPQITQITRIEEDLGKVRYPCRVVGGAVAEGLFDRGLCLPSGTAMTDGDLDRVIRTILSTREQ